MIRDINGTRAFQARVEEEKDAGDILREVHMALIEKGYDPVNQIVGYLLSGDPAYITGFRDARRKIQELDRDEILEELVRSYLEKDD